MKSSESVSFPGSTQPMVWYEGGYGGRRLYADHQGSIVAIAHPTNAWLAINGYDSWGIPNPSCVKNGQDVGHFKSSQFAGTDSGGHTHGSGNATGVGNDDAVMAAMHPKQLAIQADRDGVRSVDRMSGSFRVILHGNGSTWGDLGEAGTQQRVNAWNKPVKGGGLSGNKPKTKCK